MNYRFFGDENDYLKYGLLRCFSSSRMRVGICWMLTPGDHRTKYLEKRDEWRLHDPELFDLIHTALKQTRKRHLRYAENESFLPNAKFFGEIVPEDKTKRESSWFKKMKAALAGTDLVFFDPDNGIEPSSKTRGHKISSKHVSWDELEKMWNSGKSLLVFHYFARSEKHDECISRLSKDLVKCATNGTVYSISSSNVLFLLAYHEKHATKAQKALRLLETKWGKRLTIKPPIQ